MASSSDDLFALFGARYTIGSTSANALFVDILPGQKSITVKYLSGGTLEILPASTGMSLVGGGSQSFWSPNFTSGSTQTLAMLQALSGTGYLMGTSEVLNFDGAPRFYLSAIGATTFVTVIRACGAGV